MTRLQRCPGAPGPPRRTSWPLWSPQRRPTSCLLARRPAVVPRRWPAALRAAAAISAVPMATLLPRSRLARRMSCRSRKGSSRTRLLQPRGRPRSRQRQPDRDRGAGRGAPGVEQRGEAAARSRAEELRTPIEHDNPPALPTRISSCSRLGRLGRWAPVEFQQGRSTSHPLHNRGRPRRMGVRKRWGWRPLSRLHGRSSPRRDRPRCRTARLRMRFRPAGRRPGPKATARSKGRRRRSSRCR